MRFVLFVHSLVSDWNHGNAHFLRGIVRELLSRGHRVVVYEPVGGWSRLNLLRNHGAHAVWEFARAYPNLRSRCYVESRLDLDVALHNADVVLVHEWNTPSLVERVGRHHARTGRYVLLFHDTHHRSVSAPEQMGRYRLDEYDGLLAFGEAIEAIYLARGWARRVWTWHEAADVELFRPRPEIERERDLVWIGNWGDDERTREISELLVRPAADLRLHTTVHGVRYPPAVVADLRRRGIAYRGWLPNFRVPDVFARHRVTVHVPRRPYACALPGIPTIRVFEALACGIPLVSGPWRDSEGLFRPGTDYLVAADAEAMRRHLRALLADRAQARELAAHGRQTIVARHTCRHRVDELIDIVGEVRGASQEAVA